MDNIKAMNKIASTSAAEKKITTKVIRKISKKQIFYIMEM